MSAMLRGWAASVTSTIERPVEIPVSANRRPLAGGYAQVPARERAAGAVVDAPGALAGWPLPAWLSAASSRCASSVMFRGGVEAEGEAAATVVGVAAPCEPHPARATTKGRASGG